MAVTEVKETWSGRTGSKSELDANDTIREYRRVWRVRTDSNKDTLFTVFGAPGIPVIWDAYTNLDGTEDDAEALCRRLSGEHDQDEPKIWLVTADYSTETQGRLLDQPSEIEWGFEHSQKAVEKDVNGALIMNSAKDPYDPPVTIDDSRLTLTISRYEVGFDFERAQRFQDAVNNDPFYGDIAGQWKVKEITGKLVHHLSNTYRVVYKLQHRREGWTLSLLDAGYRKLSGGQRYPIDDPQGRPVQHPVPLDGAGAPLAAAAAPVFNPFTVYKVDNFADMALP